MLNECINDYIKQNYFENLSNLFWFFTIRIISTIIITQLKLICLCNFVCLFFIYQESMTIYSSRFLLKIRISIHVRERVEHLYGWRYSRNPCYNYQFRSAFVCIRLTVEQNSILEFKLLVVYSLISVEVQLLIELSWQLSQAYHHLQLSIELNYTLLSCFPHSVAHCVQLFIVFSCYTFSVFFVISYPELSYSLSSFVWLPQYCFKKSKNFEKIELFSFLSAMAVVLVARIPCFNLPFSSHSNRLWHSSFPTWWLLCNLACRRNPSRRNYQRSWVSWTSDADTSHSLPQNSAEKHPIKGLACLNNLKWINIGRNLLNY